jgi:hypothetical protein
MHIHSGTASGIGAQNTELDPADKLSFFTSQVLNKPIKLEN